MALVSNIGLGSGLDIQGLVKQLVAAERAAPQAVISRKRSAITTDLSALAQVKGALSSVQDTVKSLKDGNLLNGRSISTSEPSRLQTRATGTPTPGTYTIEIEQLAQAQRQRTAAVAEATTFGAGTLTVATTGSSVDVTIADGSDIFAVRDAINTQAGASVSASVIRGDNGLQLSLNSKQSGLDGAVTFTQTGGTGDLSAFTTANLTETTAAQNAILKIDGITRTNSTNVFSDALDGITLTAVEAEPGTTFTLSVQNDPSAAQKLVDNLISTFNNAVTTLRNVSAYNAETQQAAALNGDSTIRGVAGQLRTTIGSVLQAAAQQGIDLGIDTTLEGTLKLDSEQFRKALNESGDKVVAALQGEQGLTGRLDAVLSQAIRSDGTVTRKTENLETRLTDLQKNEEALNRRLVSVEARYMKQFVALDSLLGQLNSTSQYLNQQLSRLPGPGG